MRYNFELIVWPVPMPNKEVRWRGVWDFNLDDPSKSFDQSIKDLTAKHGKLTSIVLRMVPCD